VLEHLAEIAAVDPAIAGRATDEVLGFVLRLLRADGPAEIGASGIIFSVATCGHAPIIL
jgi:hypothetical protein